MDFGRAAQFFTLDSISDIAFRRPFGDLTDGEGKYDYIKTGEESITLLMPLTIYSGI
jgi:hypothetical protein